MVTASGAHRCFVVAEPRREERNAPPPVLLMHHGNGTDGLRFCVDSMKHIATKQGVALVCTSASKGVWHLGSAAPNEETLPGETNVCDQSKNDE